MKLEVYFDDKEQFGETACYIIKTDYKGNRFVAKPMLLEFVPVVEETRVDPSLRFNYADRTLGFLEALADGLARAGYKAENNDVGELKATKIHLEDMRKLVFLSEQP